MKLWKYELHAHVSPYSRCSLLSPQELVEGLVRCGYDAVVITDHYDPERFFGATKGRRFRAQVMDLYNGWRAVEELGQSVGIKVLQAVELRMEAGPEDFLLYGFTEEMAEDVGYLGDKSLKKVREILEPYGILIVQAHPFRPYLQPADPSLLDGAEVYNACVRHQSNNPLALEFARGNHLLMTAGSDSHQIPDIGRAYMQLPPAQDEKEFVSILRQYAKAPPPMEGFPQPQDW